MRESVDGIGNRSIELVEAQAQVRETMPQSPKGRRRGRRQRTRESIVVKEQSLQASAVGELFFRKRTREHVVMKTYHTKLVQ
jgi:hypothetical protein